MNKANIVGYFKLILTLIPYIFFVTLFQICILCTILKWAKVGVLRAGRYTTD